MTVTQSSGPLTSLSLFASDMITNDDPCDSCCPEHRGEQNLADRAALLADSFTVQTVILFADLTALFRNNGSLLESALLFNLFLSHGKPWKVKRSCGLQPFQSLFFADFLGQIRGVQTSRENIWGLNNNEASGVWANKLSGNIQNESWRFSICFLQNIGREVQITTLK